MQKNVLYSNASIVTLCHARWTTHLLTALHFPLGTASYLFILFLFRIIVSSLASFNGTRIIIFLPLSSFIVYSLKMCSRLEHEIWLHSFSEKQNLHSEPWVSVKFLRAGMGRECKCPIYAPTTPPHLLGLDFDSCTLDIHWIHLVLISK